MRWPAIILVACVVGSVAHAQPAPMRSSVEVAGVSGDEHGWVVVERTQPAASPAQGERTSIALYQLPGEGGGVVVQRTPVEFEAMPTHLASWGDRLAYAPPPHDALPTGLIALRVIELEPLPGGRFAFTTPAPIDPIPSEGSLESLAWSGGRLTAVVRERDGPRLIRLVGSVWQPLELNEGVDRASRLVLVSSDTHLLLGEVGQRGVLWNAPIREGDATPAWKPTLFAREAPAGMRLLPCDGQVVTLDTTGPSATIGLIRGESRAPLATLNTRAHDVVVAVGGRVALMSPPVRAQDRWHAKVLALDGAVVHDGPAELAGPIAPGEVQALALLMGSVFLSILVFVVRPASTWGAPVALPPATALADPMRRLAAFSLDLIPGVLAGWGVFGQDATIGDTGVGPLLLIAGVTIAHSTLGEALFGRTLGKLATGCRTINVRGQRPGWGQAFLHSAVKVLCPPLALFILAAPFATGPTSFGTVVIVDLPEESSSGGS